jgi:3-deoxy-D-manno-octulosonic-acid transferase
MLTVYKIIVNLIYLAAWPYLAVKRRGRSEEWRQRCALQPDEYLPIDRDRYLWGHAASVGEVQVLRKLFSALQTERPGLEFCISTYTRTGLALARKLFPEAKAVFFFPLDAHFTWRRFFGVFHPRGVVMVETEVWPYFLEFCLQRDIPIALANGRVSKKSFKRYRLVRRSLAAVLRPYRRFLMQTADDAARIVAMGAESSRVIVTGNIKHDVVDAGDTKTARDGIRKRLRVDDSAFLFIAASTRPGEEEIIAQALERIAGFPGKICCLLAPRHLERLDEVKAILDQHRLEFEIYSALEDGRGRPAPVILMDKMGVLASLFHGADLAFVGGTLADVGGHNVMEPVVAGVPVLFGPSLANVRQAADDIMGRRMGMMVTDADSLAGAVNRFISGDLRFRKYDGNGSTAAADSAAIIIRELEL